MYTMLFFALQLAGNSGLNLQLWPVLPDDNNRWDGRGSPGWQGWPGVKGQKEEKKVKKGGGEEEGEGEEILEDGHTGQSKVVP